jgi:hypothetical protein
MARFWAYLPADRATACYERVDAIARQATMPTDPRTLDQIRADVVADLLLATPDKTSAVKVELYVAVSAATLMGLRQAGCLAISTIASSTRHQSCSPASTTSPTAASAATTAAGSTPSSATARRNRSVRRNFTSDCGSGGGTSADSPNEMRSSVPSAPASRARAPVVGLPRPFSRLAMYGTERPASAATEATVRPLAWRRVRSVGPRESTRAILTEYRS